MNRHSKEGKETPLRGHYIAGPLIYRAQFVLLKIAASEIWPAGSFGERHSLFEREMEMNYGSTGAAVELQWSCTALGGFVECLCQFGVYLVCLFVWAASWAASWSQFQSFEARAS